MMPSLADKAERNPPHHVPYDAWGNRIDDIQVEDAWLELVRIGQEAGLVAMPHQAHFGRYARVVQAGLVNLFDPASAVATCPLVMTDGAAHVLSQHDPELASRYVPRLTARRDAWTAGQWMTEKEGGSDVSRSSTVARPNGDGSWSLHGTKWFTSATTADVALALARTENASEGSAGLSLFLLELRTTDGHWNGIKVRRLKDKLGTHALPTAELDLVGAIAHPVGELGRGTAKLGGLLNIARLWASLGGPAGVGYLLDLARDYAQRRYTFGSFLCHNPVHQRWLARIAAEYEAMIALNMEAALAIGSAEHGGDTLMSRLLAPLTKLACARESIWAASELVESFGGAGYVEDTGIPRVFRNIHVHCIWEGTTSVLAHDVMRVLAHSEYGEAFMADLRRRYAGISIDALDGVKARIDDAIRQLRPMVAQPKTCDARRLAWGMARTYQALLLAEAAQWQLSCKLDDRGLVAAELFARSPLVEADMSDVPDSMVAGLANGNVADSALDIAG
ncbi:acyl-CoA dehydrogenase [Salinisphaera hydrothermalis C41B8]|uniref:Acyl-CoA dehydrogenase n=1 Tax=Salinisphaera hydrothermalis (strain C41B8) TaxID=1304275 RepID=A0A084IG00_SALHC|nr:acyl-CoA dehydrogenase [Salinisphaera hydrothermalis C41B8]